VSTAASLTVAAEAVASEEKKLHETMRSWKIEMLAVPNMADISVPTGDPATALVEVATGGDKPGAQRPTYAACIESLGLHFVDRGGLQWPRVPSPQVDWLDAITYAWRKHIGGHGYATAVVPAGVRRESVLGAGMSVAACDALTQDQTWGYVRVSTIPYLIEASGSLQRAEDTLPMHIALETDLPNAQQHMHKTSGLLSVCAPRHDISVAEHEAMRTVHESFLHTLGIPYRTSVVTAIHSDPATVKTYTIELLPFADPLPFVSLSYYHDFQARRAGIRATDANGKNRFAHTVASSGVAYTSLLAALVAVHGVDGVASVIQRV
jgi:seryl-tRNA synthetase